MISVTYLLDLIMPYITIVIILGMFGTIIYTFTKKSKK
jgi:hypothetical protein